MKLVVDMNLSTDWVTALQAPGTDVIHWSEIGAGDAADDAILLWSREHRAIVLTRDLDFGAALMVNSLLSPSVIQLRIKQIRPERHVPLVKRALSLHREYLLRGALITIEGGRIRARVLDVDPDFH